VLVPYRGAQHRLPSLQQLQSVFRGQWLSKVVALHLVAVVLAQVGQLLLPLHALGDHLEVRGGSRLQGPATL
jgi:hypothetical protein